MNRSFIYCKECYYRLDGDALRLRKSTSCGHIFAVTISKVVTGLKWRVLNGTLDAEGKDAEGLRGFTTLQLKRSLSVSIYTLVTLRISHFEGHEVFFRYTYSTLSRFSSKFTLTVEAGQDTSKSDALLHRSYSHLKPMGYEIHIHQDMEVSDI